METIIEVKRYGDYDIPYTDVIMASEQKYVVKDLIKEFHIINETERLNLLNYFKLRELTENFISFLELKGFKKLKTNEVLFSD